MTHRRLLASFLPLALGLLASSAQAQWNPPAGLYGKNDPNDLRVMTWNVRDNIRTGELKTEGANSWTSLARIVAAMKPDVLLLQETGDNGCGGCVDNTFDLATVVDLFLHGGVDPFQGGNVTAYVQKYDPSFDLPYVHVSSKSDGFNRIILMSRYPFQDLNGDGTSNYSDFPFSAPDAYAPGTLSFPPIRGIQIAEIDLPDVRYGGDLVMLNMHLKAGGSSSDRTDRLNAAKNIAYFVDYWYGGAGTGSPDPNAKIGDVPAATKILDPETIVVIGGDYNEDEDTNGRKGPADWIRDAQTTGGNDGTDRDRSDGTYDDSRNACFATDRTTQGSSKLDYFTWQDSIGSATNQVILHTASIKSFCGSAYPPEFTGFLGLPEQMTLLASDHRPVIVDLALPPGSPPGPPGPKGKRTNKTPTPVSY